MANEKNLISFNNMPPERQREIARKGGMASGAARRAKRNKDWILSKDKPPRLPCLYCDGHETNGVKLCTELLTTIDEETGEKLYFDGRLFDLKCMELIISPCRENSIIAWMPVPARYKEC